MQNDQITSKSRTQRIDGLQNLAAEIERHMETLGYAIDRIGRHLEVIHHDPLSSCSRYPSGIVSAGSDKENPLLLRINVNGPKYMKPQLATFTSALQRLIDAGQAVAGHLSHSIPDHNTNPPRKILMSFKQRLPS